HITTHTDYADALPSADFVFLTFATGGIKAWKKDIATCTRYGVNQSVGDTIGPGAVIRILRTVPITLQIVREMEKRCPGAYVVNYANPEGAQCLAIQKYSSIRAFGLCHGTPNTAAELATEVFGVAPERFAYEAFGMNHLTWFTSMRVDGKDVYPSLADALDSSGFAKKEPISRELLNVFGLYPAPSDRHVSEFFSLFLKDRVMNERDYTWKNNDFIAVEAWRDEGEKKLRAALSGEGLDHFLEGSGETATHFIRALATGETVTEMANVINLGYIPNLSRDIIVELPVFVNQFGVKPQSAPPLPDGIAAKCEALGREYNLLVDAALRCDRQKALQAMYLDPLCANCNDPEGLLDVLIEENLPLLPDGWRR
ncbi:MAG: alpha-glucosidase/alpha-galactosidase, partial [Clostridia bacterium]|nr:alpha-glucosidase/alpha-galactosidase [Clostridia bacterium]